MEHEEVANKAKSKTTLDLGMSSDDFSMLNQVLQQVKGISSVSSPAYEIIDPGFSNDA